MTGDGQSTLYAKLPDSPPEVVPVDLAEITQTIRDIISGSIIDRVPFGTPTGCLLSGGLDSSVVAWLANDTYKKKFGDDAGLMTFAVGMVESEDIKNARLMADHIKSDYFPAKAEMSFFAGISTSSAFRPRSCSHDKWIFRKAFEDTLPQQIVWRLKQEFSQGSGTADILQQYFKDKISGQESAVTQQAHPMVCSQEEAFYFLIFADHFGTGRAVETVGQWVSL